ncbi:MAG: YlbF family regulator, partial [Clostridia bacterium]|nr:YlbF family regulator [Clostridia bacterium]
MEIFELAAELGKKLKDDARLVALEDAKKAYEESAELKKYMIEYEVQQKAMQAEVARADRDMQMVEV